jgi:hypothetical protein
VREEGKEQVREERDGRKRMNRKGGGRKDD